MQGIEKLLSGSAPVIWHPPASSSGQGTVLLDISCEDTEWTSVEDEMQSTIRYSTNDGCFEEKADQVCFVGVQIVIRSFLLNSSK